MKTAEEILLESDVPPAWIMSCTITAINEARKEAIEACAEAAKIEMIQIAINDFKVGEHVDKQSILKLIDQIK